MLKGLGFRHPDIQNLLISLTLVSDRSLDVYTWVMIMLSRDQRCTAR